MAHRELALNIVSGHNLKDVNVFSRMEVYAIASVNGDPNTRQRTKTDRDGARHPTWDPEDTLWFTVPPTSAAASGSGACLHVLLRTERLFSFGDRDVGEVLIPLADLLAGACDSGAATAWQCASFQVRKVQCSERRGKLSVSCRLGPVTAPLLPVGDHWANSYQLPPPWQCCPPPNAYAPQLFYPPSCPRILLGGGFGGLRFGDMEKSAYVYAGHRPV